MAYSDQEIQQRASQMVGAGADPDMVRQFINTAKAEQGQAAQPAQQATPQAAPAGSYGARPRMLEGDFAQAPRSLAVEDTTGKALAEGGIESVGPMAGQMIGARMGAAAPIAIPALGGFGGAVSYVAARKFAGEPVTLGGILSATGQGMLPGAPFEAAASKTIAKQAVREGANQFLLKNAQTIVDEGRPTTGIEAVSSFGGGAVSVPLSRAVGKVTGAGNKPAALNADEELYRLRDQAYRDLRKEGVVIPPHEVGRGSDIVSGIGGKTALQQQASLKNQPAWNRLTREDLGLQGALPLTDADLKTVRQAAYAPYEELAKISPETAVTLDNLKMARYKSQQAYEQFKGGNPGAYDAWIAAKNEAESLSDALNVAAKSAGKPDLVPKMEQSRRMIAKTYMAQRSINPATGVVDPSAFGAALLDREPLDANMARMGKFALAFRREAVEASRVPAPGVSNIGSHLAAVSASRGDPAGMLAAAYQTTMGAPTRKFLLSEASQRSYASPRMALNAVPNGLAALARFMPQSLGRDNPFLYQGQDPRQR